MASLQGMSKINEPWNDLSLSFLAFLGACGVCVNIWLYIDDRQNRGSVLHNVAKKRDELQEHMQSPEAQTRKISVGDQEALFVGQTEFKEPVTEELTPTPNVKSSQLSMSKDALKRSMARASLVK